MRILIADDDRVSRRMLESILTRYGHEVVAVADGLAAQAALLQADGPRLAILDWMMPGADGLAVCRAVRQIAEPYVYLILLTSRDRREDMLAGLDAGADDFLTKPMDSIELRARLRSGARVLELQEGLLLAQEALRRQANFDHLTGLWNRRMVLDRLGLELERARREQLPVNVLLADLDLFKQVNDTHGHAAGDEVLVEASRRMRQALGEHGFIGRYGGEEFLAVLPRCSAQEAREVAERMRADMAARPVMACGVPLSVSLSIGVASMAGAEAHTLIQSADLALYRAKALGRNGVQGPDLG